MVWLGQSSRIEFDPQKSKKVLPLQFRMEQKSNVEITASCQYFAQLVSWSVVPLARTTTAAMSRRRVDGRNMHTSVDASTLRDTRAV